MDYIHQSDYEELQEEFATHFAESGADREYDSDRDKMEFDFISDKVGSDEWEVIPDLRITTTFEEFHYSNWCRRRGGTMIRNCLTTYHHVPPEEVEYLIEQNQIFAKVGYSEKNMRLYVRTRVATLKLTPAQWRTHLAKSKENKDGV
ncbi:hypothetical protein VPHK449_0035 [Vibrio phage K449]